MDNAENSRTNSLSLHRKKRIRRLKRLIVIVTVILLLLPSILCVVLFYQINNLQKQVDILMVNTYGTTYKEGKNTIERKINQESVTNTEDLQNSIYFEENLYLKAEEFAASLEESKENEYNIKESAINNKVEQSGEEQKKNLDKQDKISDKVITKVKDPKNVDKDISGKEIYLTFDDGPSKYTDEIIDILGKYKVKATFFVIGKTDDESKRLYKRIVDEGHTLAMHSFSHDYEKIYSSLEEFKKDFTKIRTLLYDTTGYLPDIYRFPGGSGNTVSKENMSVFIDFLEKESVMYYDWNVINGDATGEKLSVEESYENVLSGVKLHKRSIVLMHDTDKKESTIKSLDSILKTLTENNAKLLALNKNVIPIQQINNTKDD